MEKPLAISTFYKRHKRRAIVLISAMSMMIMAVVLIVFTFDVSAKAKAPAFGFLSQISWVRSHTPGDGPDPGVAAQIRTHPAVDRVIPVAPRYHMFGIRIPPFTEIEASPFGVYAEDMKYLVALYDLRLKAGHLPQPYTNEVVIPETVAQNRDLKIGDVIGDPEHPAYKGANALPTAFVISGIFAQPEMPRDENWLGFVSLEFLESHEGFGVPKSAPLFVVSKPGQKDSLDDWLENELASEKYVEILTYRHEVARVRKELSDFMLIMALVESIITIVAASALAGLNHIFISQRQLEFGVLYALGFKRVQLVGRGLQEVIFTTGIAWGLSAILVLVVVLFMRFRVFAPLGLEFNLFPVIPWLYTLPIPVAVLAVTGGTVAWMLGRLDPVAIIERR